MAWIAGAVDHEVNPGYMDVHSSPTMALDTRFPAGMTNYLRTLYNDERPTTDSLRSGYQTRHTTGVKCL